MSDYSTQSSGDEQHLRLLSIFHYVLGGLHFLFGCFPFIHLSMGIAIVTGALGQPPQQGVPFPQGFDQQAGVEIEEDFQESGSTVEELIEREFRPQNNRFGPGAGMNNQEEIPRFVGWMFIAVSTFMICFIWSLALLQVLTGRRLDQRRSHSFCFVVACLECLQMPLGTVLGVFTIIVLSRPSVKELFQANKPS